MVVGALSDNWCELLGSNCNDSRNSFPIKATTATVSELTEFNEETGTITWWQPIYYTKVFILYFTTFHVCIYHVYTNLMWCYNLNYQKLLKAIWILNLYKFLSGLNVKLGRCWVEFLPTFCDVSVMKLDDAVIGKYFARKWLKIH